MSNQDKHGLSVVERQSKPAPRRGLAGRPRRGVTAEAISEVNRLMLEGGPHDRVLRVICRRAAELADDADVRAVRPVSEGGREPPAPPPSPRALRIPLRIRSRTVAVLEATDKSGRGFDSERLDALRRFVAEAGLLIETHLSASTIPLDAPSLERRRRQVSGRLQRLALPAELEVGALEKGLDPLAATAVGLTRATGCTIALVGPDACLRTVGSSGLDPRLVRAIDESTRAGAPHPALDCIAHGLPVVVVNERERLLADPRLREVQALLEEQAWDALGCVPLTVGEAVNGALCYYFSPEDRPDEAGLRSLRALASRAGQLLASAELVASTHRLAATEERQRIARELHDSVSQALYGVALGARTALARLDQDDVALAHQAMEYVAQQAEAGEAELRALIFELIPHSLEDEGLAAAVTKHAAAVQARYGVIVDVRADPLPSAAVESQHAAYRIVQEATHNAVEHGHCTHLTVRLAVDDADLRIDVVDDGGGFDPAVPHPGHLGLRGMRERASLLGGSCEVTSRPGRTQVIARLPRHPAED